MPTRAEYEAAIEAVYALHDSIVQTRRALTFKGSPEFRNLRNHGQRLWNIRKQLALACEAEHGEHPDPRGIPFVTQAS